MAFYFVSTLVLAVGGRGVLQFYTEKKVLGRMILMMGRVCDDRKLME